MGLALPAILVGGVRPSGSSRYVEDWNDTYGRLAVDFYMVIGLADGILGARID